MGEGVREAECSRGRSWVLMQLPQRPWPQAGPWALISPSCLPGHVTLLELLLPLSVVSREGSRSDAPPSSWWDEHGHPRRGIVQNPQHPLST